MKEIRNKYQSGKLQKCIETNGKLERQESERQKEKTN